jgi:hypothetical protein
MPFKLYAKIISTKLQVSRIKTSFLEIITSSLWFISKNIIQKLWVNSSWMSCIWTWTENQLISRMKKFKRRRCSSTIRTWEPVRKKEFHTSPWSLLWSFWMDNTTMMKMMMKFSSTLNQSQLKGLKWMSISFKKQMKNRYINLRTSSRWSKLLKSQKKLKMKSQRVFEKNSKFLRTLTNLTLILTSLESKTTLKESFDQFGVAKKSSLMF